MDLHERNVFITGPSFHVDLAPLDALHPVHYLRRLLIFRCASPAQRSAQLSAFHAGVQRLVQRCPILGGRVVPLSSDEAASHPHSEAADWRTIVPDAGIELIVRDLRTKLLPFEELEAGNFAPTALPYDLLVPVPEGIGNDRPFAAGKLQYSAIEGGTIITYTTSHSVADGSGANEVMRILGEEIRKAQDSSTGQSTQVKTPTVVGLDRSPIRNVASNVPFELSDHPGFIDVATLTGSSSAAVSQANSVTAKFVASAPEVPILLHIAPPGLARLKADATTPDAPPISTHDALSAMLWVLTLRLRVHRALSSSPLPPDSSELNSLDANFYMPSDGRRHLGIPDTYVGNAVYQLSASLPIVKLLPTLENAPPLTVARDSDPNSSLSVSLREAAQAIRAAILAVDSTKVASYVAHTRQEWVNWRFLTDYATTGLAMGTDWTSGGVYSHDYGEAFGPLMAFRYPGDAFSCIYPKRRDGGADIQIAALDAERGDIMEAMARYLTNP